VTTSFLWCIAIIPVRYLVRWEHAHPDASQLGFHARAGPLRCQAEPIVPIESRLLPSRSSKIQRGRRSNPQFLNAPFRVAAKGAHVLSDSNETALEFQRRRHETWCIIRPWVVVTAAAFIAIGLAFNFLGLFDELGKLTLVFSGFVVLLASIGRIALTVSKRY
jgi:hypothetical protein